MCPVSSIWCTAWPNTRKPGRSARSRPNNCTPRFFGPDPAVFAHVALLDGTISGCAIWFRNFSTWDGVHGIHLEDLYVTPAARGSGLGRALLAALAHEARTHGYTRVSWSVLTWNTPSIGFYESLGARVQDDWVGYRLSGEALTALAATAQTAADE